MPLHEFFDGSFEERTSANWGETYRYNGPSEPVKQIALDVALSNAILPIEPPYPNSSWEMAFYGPDIRCTDLPPKEHIAMEQNIVDYLNGTAHAVRPTQSPSFLSWFTRRYYYPDPNDRINGQFYYFVKVPYSKPDGLTSPVDIDWQFNDPAEIFAEWHGLDPSGRSDYPMPTLYIIVLPKMLQGATNSTKIARYDPGGTCYTNRTDADGAHAIGSAMCPLDIYGSNATMLRCELFNSSYETKFDYLNGLQTITIDIADQKPNNAVSMVDFVLGPVPASQADLFRPIGPPLNTCARFDLPFEGHPDCIIDRHSLERLSFQSVFHAFALQLLGIIEGAPEYLTMNVTSNIRSTSLMNTKELKYLSEYELSKYKQVSKDNISLQKALWDAGSTLGQHVSGLSSFRDLYDYKASLKAALESMFRNLTVSLMSSPVFQLNYSSPGAPPYTNITSFTYDTVYAYATAKLWVAYGLATLFTLGAASLGMLAIQENGASYDNSFSTVLRTTRAAELSAEIQPTDLDGKSPLPSYLRKASITMSRAKSNVGSTLESSAACSAEQTSLLMQDNYLPSVERRKSSATP